MALIMRNKKVILLAGGFTAAALAFTGCSSGSSSSASSAASVVASAASSAASAAESGASEAASAVESAASAEASMSVPAEEASALSSADPAQIDTVLESGWTKLSAEQQAQFCTEFKAMPPAESYKTWATSAATAAGMSPEAFEAAIPQATYEAFYTPKCP